MSLPRPFLFALLLVLLVPVALRSQQAVSSSAADDSIRLNQIQIIGTHNSYHAGLAPSEARLLAKTDPVEERALEYQHPSLTTQLENGNRELELDVYPDPAGGLYVVSRSLKDVVAAGLPPDPADFYPEGLMQKPGFKVMHKPDTDYRSNCQPFVECLRVIHSWSMQHPAHVPIYLFIETKVPTTLRPSDLDALDAEVRSVFSAEEMITPDDMRGNAPTLREAVRKTGWPTLGLSRGKVLFLMARSEVANAYREGHEHLRGRVMFVNGPLQDPDTVFTVQSKDKHGEIERLIGEGLLVLTRCDADTNEARANDTERRRTALASGAQILSTDYPSGEPSPWGSYTVQFEEHLVARCSPLFRRNGCVSEGLEPAGREEPRMATR